MQKSFFPVFLGMVPVSLGVVITFLIVAMIGPEVLYGFTVQHITLIRIGSLILFFLCAVVFITAMENRSKIMPLLVFSAAANLALQMFVIFFLKVA